MDKTFNCVTDTPEEYFECFMEGLIERNPGEPEFHQAVSEVSKSIVPFIFENPKYLKGQILERLTEPDRLLSFRVCWEDDQGNIRTNRGFRVQFNNSIGPYKGGLRFHPSVNQSIFKFLGFEQIFKNSLTGLPIGAGKGGANFDPKGKSDAEIMRFCQSYMIELYRHIGEDVDVPAGDIGVGGREISYMFGMYKRITNRFTGTLTGKGIEYGGSLIREEATGYGLVYFADDVVKHHNDTLEGKTCLVTGAGNVAQFAVEKLIDKGAKVITLSDSRGFILVKDGIHQELLERIKEHKKAGKSLGELKEKGIEYFEGKTPWGVEADYAFPSATQNEIDLEDAKALVKSGVKGVFEGANMPSTNEAIEYFLSEKILFGPAKAANAGGVSISALEMSQNNLGLSWEREKVDGELQKIMKRIHQTCVKYGEKDGKTCYITGANIGGFVKVADAMLKFGVY
ncbi:MAG: NADP-specific glutamate dehydrogenase [Halobacteriovoraceae bacterium]|nr:NADP-specific glutamate dehydrogenase [Halobacteriovoraceae bacterium]